MLNKIKKVKIVIQRKMIQKMMYINTDLYMKCYIKFLKKRGMDIKGMPNYISNDVHFDGKDFSIIHLGEGCTISREVLFLTHDYSKHTVFQGLKSELKNEIKETLESRDENNKLLDLRGIHIGDYSFVGARTLLMPGTHIGSNSIVGGVQLLKDIITII